MKRISVIFIGLIMMVPMSVRAEEKMKGDGGNQNPSVTQYVDPTHTSSANAATTAPQYEGVEITSAEQSRIASTAYVKGAYNSAIRSVNRLDQDKQANLNSGNNGNISDSGSGPVVTGVSASNGVVTVSKGQITIPVGSSSGSGGQANIWIQ